MEPKKGDLKANAFDWTFDHLSQEAKDYLAGLPEQHEVTLPEWQVLLCHGSPASHSEHLLPETPTSRLAELARATRAKVILCGHSHQAFTRQVEGSLFVNTGSVGRPDDGDPRACYAVLDLQPGKIGVVHYRVPYLVEDEVEAIREKGLPEEFAKMTMLGRSLDYIQSIQAVSASQEVCYP